MSKITLNNVSSFQNDSTAVASYTANNATLTTAFDNTLSRDGSTPNQMLSNLDMNSFRILNLPAPASGTDPIRVQDLSSYVTTTANQLTVPASTTSGNIVTWNATNGLTLGTGLAVPLAVVNGGTGVTTSTGSGSNVLGTAPTITLPNATGLPLTTGVTGTLPVANGGTGDTGTAWSTWSPTISSLTGSITTVGTVTARFKTIGKTVFFQIFISITNNGTGATALTFTLPSAPVSTLQVFGGFNINTSNQCGAYIGTGSTVYVIRYDASYPVAGGQTVSIGGCYEAA